ncbi:hypothetical protein [Alteromonas lipolytica]|uniref:MSHA biogenesis protein MshI n=1 Tax=Alteromonas lipolytica TaxID=1856405 RepID=A0A1E8F8I6_9ALTE|nr:hypothetical protein [Alteromonas lipolytica]OFI32231.1 hypothetical protein BFC17_08415 [Alteromonas lipolytica]GGF82830.1 hypothetical protein GCM10011338_38850 [Alteromonas lipolytica]
MSDMKSRINFYTEDFEPRLDVLSLTSISIAWGVTLAVLLLIWAGIAWYGSVKHTELAALQAQQQQLSSEVNTLKTTLEQRKPDAGLARTLEQRQQELANRELLVRELSQREQIKQQGFAALLDSLAEKNSQDIWLDAIEVSENMMLLEGQLSNPQAMPKWLQRLGQTSSFSGRTFDSTRLYREDDTLRFELNMARVAEAAQQGGQR